MKRCRKLEEIREKIKLEFPGVELHQYKSTIYFKFNDSIQVYLSIREWKLYNLCISYDYPGLVAGKQFLEITEIKSIKVCINGLEKELEKYNINRDEVF